MRARRPCRRLCPTLSSSSTAVFFLPRCNTAPSPIGSLTHPPLARPVCFLLPRRPRLPDAVAPLARCLLPPPRSLARSLRRANLPSIHKPNTSPNAYVAAPIPCPSRSPRPAPQRTPFTAANRVSTRPRSHHPTSSPHSSRFTATTATRPSCTHSTPPPPPTPPPVLRPPLTAFPPPRFRSMGQLRIPRSERPSTNSHTPVSVSRVLRRAPSWRPRATSVLTHGILLTATVPHPFRHEPSVELSWRRGQKCCDALGSARAQR